MELWLPLLLAVSFRQVVSQQAPKISYISQEQIRDVGGIVQFDCGVEHLGPFPLIWLKKGDSDVPISSGNGLIVHDDRFTFRRDKGSSIVSLQIRDIQETDAGTYECRVSTSVTQFISATVKLHIRRSPVIYDTSTRSRIAREGETVELSCYAGGFPEPKLSWRRENNAVLPTGGSIYRGTTLKIVNIRKEDRGTYYCVAENGVGRGARRNVAVEVEFAPVIRTPRPRMGQALQYDMDLVCQVEAYPPPAIVWIKDGIQLSNNQHYSISHFATDDQFTDTTLRVITVEKRQFGQYTCKATNKIGSNEASMELFESPIPICPPACGQYQYGGADTLPQSFVLVFIGTILTFFNRNIFT